MLIHYSSSQDSRDGRRADTANNRNPSAESRHHPPPSQRSAPALSKASPDKPDPSSATPHGLPPLLSPVHEPLGNPYGLPNILSPTLPSNIQAELDRLETQRKRAESNASTSSSDRKSHTLAVPSTQSQEPDPASKNESRIRSVSVNGKSPTLEAAQATEKADTSLVVKLKFSKTKVPTVKKILRLPPKRANIEKKERPDPPKEVSAELQAIAVDRAVIKKKPIPKVAARRPPDASTPMATPVSKPAITTTKPSEKRPRVDDEASLAVPSKRQRAMSAQDRPITPVQQAAPAPALSNEASTQKLQVQYTTPKKDVKAVNMLRTHSAESYDATPGRSGATPAVKLEHRAGPTSAPLNGKKQADISLLAQTSMKLNQMGRALKHEATKILTAAGNKVSKQDEKRAAVTNLECIL